MNPVPFAREVLLKLNNLLTMCHSDPFWSKNTLLHLLSEKVESDRLTFESASFPHFVHFSLNRVIGMIRCWQHFTCWATFRVRIVLPDVFWNQKWNQFTDSSWERKQSKAVVNYAPFSNCIILFLVFPV